MSDFFDLKIKVTGNHIDLLGHVNNVVYVQWMQDVASAHIEHIGVGLEKYLQMNCAMAAVNHNVHYCKSAVKDDELILRTWLKDISPIYSFREYIFYRPNDKSIVFKGSTQWVCIEISTGKPKRMPDLFKQAYQPIFTEYNPLDFSKYH